MALTEEQKRKLREKADAEIAAIKQKEEEDEYYEQILAEKGIVRSVNSSGNQSNTQTMLFLKIMIVLFAIAAGISAFLPFISVAGFGKASLVDVADAARREFKWFLFGSSQNVVDEQVLYLCIPMLQFWGIIFLASHTAINVMTGHYIASIACGFVGIFSAFYNNNFWTKVLSVSRVNILTQHGVGWYILLLGSFGIVIFTIIIQFYKQQNKISQKQSHNNLWTIIDILISIIELVILFAWFNM